jgi:hypothetical protein
MFLFLKACVQQTRHWNFKVVTRVRPGDAEEEDRSDEQVSDEELEANKFNFAEVIETRIGDAVAGENEEEQRRSKTGVRQGAKDVANPGSWHTTTTPRTRRPRSREIAKSVRSRGHVSEAGVYRCEQRVVRQRSFLSSTQSKTFGSGGRRKKKKNKEGKVRLKRAQYEILENMRRRLCHELSQQSKGLELDEPLLWLMHGGPGAGKSMIIKMLKELFRDVCGWQMGLEFQVAALQAVVAQQLGGDTLRRACGINPFGGNKPQDDKSRGKASQKQANVAGRVMQWRWLIIDEGSMVSAKLLAEIDVELRRMVRAKHTLRGDAEGLSRAFGGINILFSGDFWQLDLLSRGFLAEIPMQCSELRNSIRSLT